MKQQTLTKQKRAYILLLMFLVAFQFRIANAQTTFTGNNLPSGYTNLQLRSKNDVAIDQNNNTWVAFQRIGLGKFDGAAWTMYNVATTSLPTDTVTSVSIAGNGNIYATTAAGLSVFDGVVWTHYNSQNSPLPISGASTVELNGSQAWIGTTNGIYMFDGTNWTNYNTSNSSLTNDSITCIAFNSNNDVLAGTRNGVSLFSQNVWTTLNTTGITQTTIADIEVLNGTEIWITVPDGNNYFYSSGIFNSIITILPPQLMACTSFQAENGICIKKSNNNIVLFVADPNLNLGVLCEIDTSHSVKSLQLSQPHTGFLNSFLFDIKNNDVSCITNLNTIGNYAKLYKADVSATTPLLLTSDYLESSDLNVNQVRARINNLGDLHWDPISQTPIYEVPKCSGKNSDYASGLWVGGIDNNNQIHLAAATYRQSGVDYVTGPLDTITGTTDSITAATYDRVWKVNKTTLDDFINNFQQGNVQNGSYLIPEVIANWPAHGGGTFSHSLAPFVDYNNDGNYNPMDGDYPSIHGDQEIWFIFNDQRSHMESTCAPMGLEIHGKAYAYNCDNASPYNEVLNYTTFYQYKIINRSMNTYNQTLIGMMVDPDLGNASDDNVGSNVSLNTGTCFNLDSIDPGLGGYGLYPPYQNVTILRGPLADPGDGIDNDKDGVLDEFGECNMMTHFLSYENVNNSPFGNPEVCDDYYQYLNGIWLDGMPVTYGDNGRNPANAACNYMFPGTTDPAFPSQNWTMAGAGIPPSDMRFTISSGTFTLGPGESRTFDFAYIYTRDTTGNWPANANANNVTQVSKVIQWFNNGLVSCPAPTAVNENGGASELISVHPNPANDIIQLGNIDLNKNYTYIITDVIGRSCLQGALINSTINVHTLQPGAYTVQINSNNNISTTRFIKE